MRDVYDILNEFEEHGVTGAREGFCQKLKKLVNEKYEGATSYARTAKFTDEYMAYLYDLEKFRAPDKAPSMSGIKDLASKNIPNWLNGRGVVKRESIIDLAFILADPEKKNGEQIANELLRSMHYPQLHASSEIELFYIFALRQGLGYTDCLRLYKAYLERGGSSVLPVEDTGAYKTSTVFHDAMVDIENEEKLFAFVDSQRQYFGVASRKMNEIVSKSFHRMLAHEVVIENAGEEPDLIAERIKEYIDKEEKNLNFFDPEGIERELRRAKETPFRVLLSSRKNAAALCELIEKNGGEAEKRESEYGSIIDLKLDFYLYYASDDSLLAFKDRVVKETMGDDNNCYLDSSDYNNYIKNYADYMDQAAVALKGKNDKAYYRLLMERKRTRPIFYPIKGHPKSNVDYDSSEGCLFRTVFDDLGEAVKNRQSLSREGLCLWLLFYYRENGRTGLFYDMDAINSLIQTRYAVLDTDDYFDNYLATVLSFRLEDGRVMYGNEEIEDTDLKTENIHTLRHSVVRLFKEIFDPDFAAESFMDTSNSTTSLIYDSTRQRLGLKRKPRKSKGGKGKKLGK